MPTRYKISVSYDGTNFFGWQAQPQHRTVQGEMERLLTGMASQQRVRVESSGRTDAGVHARRQVAHFDLPAAVDARRFQYGLNAQLSRDIRVMSFGRVPAGFHARFSVVAKEYRYFIYNGLLVPPHKRLYRLPEGRRLDEERMQTAADLLVGKHDFAPFSANPKRELGGTVRTLHSFKVKRRGADIILVLRGNGFLYKMVRSLVGFLIRVGVGSVHPEAVYDVMEHGSRTGFVPTARPQGLFLWKVEY